MNTSVGLSFVQTVFISAMLESYGRWRINYSTLQFLSYSRNYTAVVCTDGTKRQQVSQHSSEKAIDSSFSNLR